MTFLSNPIRATGRERWSPVQGAAISAHLRTRVGIVVDNARRDQQRGVAGQLDTPVGS